MASVTPVLPEIKRSDFPDDFLFGSAASAFQVEGAAAEDGRAKSIWDVYTEDPTKIKGGDKATVAIDQYHRFKGDIKLMKKIGLKAYRFSISWSRVLPGGRYNAGVNEKGIEYYNNLINELLANDMEPYVTLFHWDVPLSLENEYGGFLDKQIVDDFRDFADLCFWEFGDRVKHWITVNEPWTFAVQGYTGMGNAPGRGNSAQSSSPTIQPSLPAHKGSNCSLLFDSDGAGDPGREPYQVTHNLLLAHASAVDLYRKQYKGSQGGQIGFTLVSQWWMPSDKNKPEDQDACDRMKDFFFGWYMSPVVFGDYPKTMKDNVGVRLPKFSREERNLLIGSLDFLGLNYYTARYTKDQPYNKNDLSYLNDCRAATDVKDAHKKVIGEKSGSDWLYSVPSGMTALLTYIKENYNDPVIYITENGWDETNGDSGIPIQKYGDDGKLIWPPPMKIVTISEARQDESRIRYIINHLAAVKDAMKLDKDKKVTGANVKGYFYWSFIDNFEWAEGYSVRYGLIYADFKNSLARSPKNSALWFMDFLKNKASTGAQTKLPSKRPLPAPDNMEEDSENGTPSRAPKRNVIYRV